MMDTGGYSKGFLLGIGGLLIMAGVAGWYVYSNKQSVGNAAVTVTERATGTGASATSEETLKLQQEASEILRAIAILKTLNLDTEFFNDPRFTSLRDTPVDIPAEEPPAGGKAFILGSGASPRTR